MGRALGLVISLICMGCLLYGGNLIANSSFELPSKEGVPPLNWSFNPPNIEAASDWSVAHSGKASLRISVPPDAPLGWYSAYQEFPLSPRNQHLTLSVYVRTKDVRGGAGAYCSINFFRGGSRISFHWRTIGLYCF